MVSVLWSFLSGHPARHSQPHAPGLRHRKRQYGRYLPAGASFNEELSKHKTSRLRRLTWWRYRKNGRNEQLRHAGCQLYNRDLVKLRFEQPRALIIFREALQRSLPAPDRSITSNPQKLGGILQNL